MNIKEVEGNRKMKSHFRLKIVSQRTKEKLLFTMSWNTRELWKVRY